MISTAARITLVVTITYFFLVLSIKLIKIISYRTCSYKSQTWTQTIVCWSKYFNSQVSNSDLTISCKEKYPAEAVQKTFKTWYSPHFKRFVTFYFLLRLLNNKTRLIKRIPPVKRSLVGFTKITISLDFSINKKTIT